MTQQFEPDDYIELKFIARQAQQRADSIRVWVGGLLSENDETLGHVLYSAAFQTHQMQRILHDYQEALDRAKAKLAAKGDENMSESTEQKPDNTNSDPAVEKQVENPVETVVTEDGPHTFVKEQ